MTRLDDLETMVTLHLMTRLDDVVTMMACHLMTRDSDMALEKHQLEDKELP